MISRPCLLSLPAALLAAALTGTTAATCDADEAAKLLASLAAIGG